jgi:hypothetical protein
VVLHQNTLGPLGVKRRKKNNRPRAAASAATPFRLLYYFKLGISDYYILRSLFFIFFGTNESTPSLQEEEHTTNPAGLRSLSACAIGKLVVREFAVALRQQLRFGLIMTCID